MKQFLLFFLFLVGISTAQVRKTTVMTHFPGVPGTTACVQNEFGMNDATADLYVCGADLLFHLITGSPSAPPQAQQFSVSPATVNFNQVQTSSQSQSQSIAFTSSGTVGVTISVSQSGSTDFVFPSLHSCDGLQASGAVCILTFNFSPSSTGAKSGTITITTDIPGSAPFVVSLLGTGTSGATSPLNVSATDTGSGTIKSSEVPPLINCTIAPPALPTGTCATNVPNGTILTLTATPAAGSHFQAFNGATCSVSPCTLTVSTPGFTVTGDFSANGPANVAGIAVNPLTLNFGTQQNNVVTPFSQVIELSNTSSTVPLAINSAVISDSHFTSPNIHACDGIIPVLASCPLSILFKPTSGIAFSGTLTINSNAQGIAPTVALSGSGTASVTRTLTVTPQGSGSGIVNSDETSPLISCPPQCSASYVDGSTPILTASPNTGSTFVNFSGADSSTSPSTVTMSANKTVIPTFNLLPPQRHITIACGGQGTGTIVSDMGGINALCTAGVPSGIFSATYVDGSTPTFTESPSSSGTGTCTGASCTFTSWSGVLNCTTGTTCKSTISGDLVLTANFAAPASGAPIQLIQTINGGSAGGTSISCSNLTNNNSTAATSSYATASVTPSSNNLVLVTVTSRLISGNGPGAITSITGSSLTYVNIASMTVNFGGIEGTGRQYRQETWRALGASPTTGALTINFGTSPTNVSWSVSQCSGINTSGSNGSGAIGNTAESDNASSAYPSPLSTALTFSGGSTSGTYASGSIGRSSATLAPGTSMSTLGLKESSGLSILDEWAAGNVSPATETYAEAGDVATLTVMELLAGASNNVTGTFSSAQGAGHLNVVYVGWNDNTTTISGVTDSSGNTYTQSACSPKAISGNSLALWYSPNIAAAGAGANTVTVAMSASPSSRVILGSEYSGPIASPVDVCAGTTGTSTSPSSGNLTTTVAGDLLTSAAKVANSISAAGSGFTQRISLSTSDAEDQQGVAIGTYANAPTQSSSGNWADIAAAWKTAGTVPTVFSFALINGTGSGTVTAAGISCTYTNGIPSSTGCGVQVSSGSTLTLTATPASGFGFGGYSGAGCGANPQCTTQAITTNTQVSVNFSSGCSGPFSITSQPPVTCPFYGQGVNNVTNKRLPADVMSHLATGGNTIAQTAVAGAFVQYQTPGSDDGGIPLWYSKPTDPYYQTAGCSLNNFGPTFAFRAPNNANTTDQARPDITPVHSGDNFIRIWDQATGIAWGLYPSSHTSGTPYSLGNSSATTPAGAPVIPNANSTTACGLAKNIFTDQDWGAGNGWKNGQGAEGSAGFAPFVGIVRSQELIQGAINHALVLGVACTNAYNGSFKVFPSNSTTAACSVATTMPPNGALLFFDYTDAQIAGMGLPAWQKTLVTAMSHYGGYVDITGNSSGSGGLGYIWESGMAYQMQTGGTVSVLSNGMKINGGTVDPVFAFLQAQGFACNGSSGTSSCKYNINWLSGIPNVGGTGISSHIHMADPCIALGYANQPGACF